MRKLLKNKNLLFVFFILLVAAFLRLYKIAGYMTFLGDEGRDVLVVYNILHGNLTLLGPTASVGGFFMGPIYYYFMTPFLWLFNYSPVGPAVMVALFGMATVFLVYKVAAEFFDVKAAVFASLLYAISPLIIAYSRSSWNPNLMPFFSILTVYFLYKATLKSSSKLFILTGFFYGILLQLHYTSTFLIPAIILYLIIVEIFSQKKLKNKFFSVFSRYVYVLSGVLIGFSAFLLFEVRHGFPNIQNILRFVLFSGETGNNAHFFDNVENVFFRLFGRLITKFPPIEDVSINSSLINIDLFIVNFKIPVFYLFYFTLFLAYASILAFLLKFFKTIFEKKDFKKYIILSLWGFFGVFMFGFYKKSIYDYYLGFMFPLSFLLVGNLLSSFYTNSQELVRYIANFFSKSSEDRGGNRLKRIDIAGKSIAVVIFTGLVVLNLTGVPFRYPPNQQLAQVEKISRFVFDKTNGKPFNFALITGGNSDHGYRYFFKLWGKDPITIENEMNDPKRNTVTDQLLVVCEKIPCAPLGDPLWEVAGFGRGEIIGKWNVSVVEVYKLSHYKGN